MCPDFLDAAAAAAHEKVELVGQMLLGAGFF